MSSFMEDHADTLSANGYHILPIIPSQKEPGQYVNGAWYPKSSWQSYCTKAANQFEIDAWKRWPDCGVGLACGSVIGIDIDVLTDPDVAFGLERLAREMLGETVAVRIGQAPKRALFYRAETPFRGRKKHPLEVYGLGSQMVIHGVHPVTQRPYEWVDGSLAEIDIGKLPVISEAMALAWLEEAFKRVPASLKPATLAKPEAGPSASNHANDPRGTYEAVKSALEFLPNSDLDGASWVQIMNAIKAALGEEGRDLWLDWSKSSAKSGASGKGDTAERRWKTARPHSIGAGTIYHLAGERGWLPEADLILNGTDAERADAPHPAQALLDSSKAKSQVTTTKRAEQTSHRSRRSQYPPPASIMDGLDGWLEIFVNHVLTTSKSQQPYLALGAALAAISAASGRRYVAEDGTRPNITIVALAYSGGGKERPRQFLADVFIEAGMSEYLGGSRIASSAGVLTALKDYPVVLFPLDEIGHVFGINASRNAGSHKAEILPLLTELFSKAGGQYLGTNLADSKLNPKIVLHQPHITLYGATAPVTFWKAFTPDQLLDGSLARWLIMETPDNYPDKQFSKNLSTPPELIAGLQRLSGTAMEGNLAGTRPARMAHDKPYEAEIVPFDVEARAIFEAIGKEETGLKRKYEGTARAVTWSRFQEHTIRVAMWKALSRFAVNPKQASPVITGADARWAVIFTRDAIEHALTQQSGNISDSANETNIQALLNFIRENGEVTATELSRARGVTRMVAKDRDLLLADQIKHGFILTRTAPTGGKTDTTFYRLPPTIH